MKSNFPYSLFAKKYIFVISIIKKDIALDIVRRRTTTNLIANKKREEKETLKVFNNLLVPLKSHICS